MIHSPKFVALLDACVLYPAPIRDLLLNLADVDLYSPKWTDRIHQEWTRNLLLNRPELTADQLQRTTQAMNNAFPDANVVNYEALIDSLTLPDPDDCHVLAAAIRCQANVLITANLKDFPSAVVSLFDLEVQHPDEFITNLIDLDSRRALMAFDQQVSHLKKPPMTPRQVLENFKKVGLKVTANRLNSLL